ncbi:TPA: hypothetical protein UM684_000389 [Stenotrophomonas maltophilia]|uniref:hypothetical protein n=1 Tax=Stenotrophomonas maltophilia TaxID=40324 RepID=UPI00066B73F9|nr:hypothetical protein [Stenotrophomonas maltophilia]EKT4447420.1 hypothetical protein [Stenotrophomonas maltophilia]MBH1379482.1 hypothetical protein [Stenotrophomonas maltophilia]MBH1395887.1 hypothetical protein [Stenotrophomonas maltophilia]MBH1463992.1 hypothetical protein [Stenotrophomonas maltophilia]MBH1468983.1 hypothetical protein [Stenotrophomonas maltophilia]
MEELPKRKKKPGRKDGFPWKSIIAVVIIVGVVLAVTEMGRVDREYRAQANRQAFGAMQSALHGDKFVARPAADTIPASDADQNDQKAETDPSSNVK